MASDSFDRAWDLVKAPLWTEEGTTADYEPEDYTDSEIPIGRDYPGQRFGLIPKIDRGEWMDEAADMVALPHGSALARFWESKNKDARGFASLQEGDSPDDPKDPYHQIAMFELANEIRGTGQARDRLMEMIAELREHDPDATSTHVTHSESHTADLWDKLVDEGLIDSASTKPYVTTTSEGRLLPYTENRSE